MSILRSLRVLVVEDDVDTREMYVLFLQTEHIEVRAVTNADEAFILATEWQPDVVITDFLLRGGANGAELCKRLHADDRTRHIPTLVVTGSTRKQDAEAILGAGCADIRLKPYRLDALVADVRRLAPSRSSALA
jgi:CheY-like chemotaxis protein